MTPHEQRSHPTVEAAKVATKKMAAKAVKLGRQRAEARRALAKPDSFSDIPAPPKVARLLKGSYETDLLGPRR